MVDERGELGEENQNNLEEFGDTFNNQDFLSVDGNYSVNIGIINVTDSKLRLLLKDNLQRINGNKDWMQALALVLATIIPLKSAEFHETFSIDPVYWNALYILIFLVSLYLLVKSVIDFFFRRMTIDELVDQIKDESKKFQ